MTESKNGTHGIEYAVMALGADISRDDMWAVKHLIDVMKQGQGDRVLAAMKEQWGRNLNERLEELSDRGGQYEILVHAVRNHPYHEKVSRRDDNEGRTQHDEKNNTKEEEPLSRESNSPDLPGWWMGMWFLWGLAGAIAAVSLTTDIPLGFVPAMFLAVLGLFIPLAWIALEKIMRKRR